MTGWILVVAIIVPIIQVILYLWDARFGLLYWGIIFLAIFLGLSSKFELTSIAYIVACSFLAVLLTLVIMGGTGGCFDSTTFNIVAVIVYILLYLIGTTCIVNPTIERNKYNANVIPIEECEISEEKRYEIFSDDDFSSQKRVDFSSIIYVETQSTNKNYYIIYCKLNDDIHETNTLPILIYEEDIDVIIQSNGVEAEASEYLLKIEEIYYKEDRNKEPNEIQVASVVERYELHVNESTYSGRVILSEN